MRPSMLSDVVRCSSRVPHHRSTSARLVEASEHFVHASREASDATVRVSAQLRRLQLMVAVNLVLVLGLLAAVLIALR